MPCWRKGIGVVAAALTVFACGTTSGGSGGSTPTVSASAVALVSPTAASPTCPTAATVGAALGVTLPDAVGVTGGSSQLPAGVKAVVCEYHASTYNVIIELLSNADPSLISMFSSRFPVPYMSVPGVGDQARAFRVSIGSTRFNEGVVATRGRHLVLVDATATPASLAQVEALVNALV